MIVKNTYSNDEREELRIKFAHHRNAGHSIRKAVEVIGISHSTYYKWNENNTWDKSDGWKRGGYGKESGDGKRSGYGKGSG